MTAKTLQIPSGLQSPESLMRLALDAARQGIRGANPLVGAVIASPAGEVLQVGWHRGAGTAHAEADAITRAQGAGIDLTGTHMYVSLEPCNHTGRTGPCSQAVADAGIAYLHYAYADSTETAAGGADYLRSQSVQVESGLLAEEAKELNRRWFEAAAQKRPWVTGKIASSLDGFIAAADGTSQWITGADARADGHTIRARADAIAVGTQTVFADNPKLTARSTAGHELSQQPLRVVVGEREIPAESALAQDSNWVQIASRSPRVVLDELYARGVRHLMIEGGPTLLSAFLQANLVDEIFWYQAPKLLGAGRRAVSDLGIESLAGAQQWELDDLGASPALMQLGKDVRLHLIAQN